MTTASRPGVEVTSIQKPVRYLSLDVLRGMTIALMIVVNTPGSWDTIYAPFRHAAWHGFTPTDLVFPSFLFVVGNAMSFSMKKFGDDSGLFWRKVIKRTLLIFIIGLLLNACPFMEHSEEGIVPFDFSQIRIMGVLQRIALCYFIAAVAIRYLDKRGVIIFSVISLIGYWIVAYLVGDACAPYTLEGNASGKVDLMLIPAKNLYQGFGLPFDPEGLLSTWPAVVNVLVGYLAGLFVQQQTSYANSIRGLAWAGVLSVAVGLLWALVFPINKPIWTSSYVVFSSGLLLLILALLILLIDKHKKKGWTPFFVAFGRNPLFIYIIAWVLISVLSFIRVGDGSLSGWLYEHLFLSWLSGPNASLLFALSYMLLMWMLAYWLDRKRIYVKV